MTYKFPLTKAIATLTAITVTLSQTRAAEVNAAGSIQDNAGGQVSGWQSTDVLKTIDIDGDNVYGTIFADNPGTGSHGNTGAGSEVVGLFLPDFPFQGVVTNLDNFFDIDSAIGAPAPSKEDQNAGIVYTNTDNSPQLTFHFTLTGPVGYYADKTVRMGFMYDIAEPGRTGSSIMLAQSDGLGGVPGIQSTTPSNGIADMYFFDITGAESGQQFTVNVFGAPDVNYFSGYSMDVVPEPTSFGLMGIAALGFGLRRSRKTA